MTPKETFVLTFPTNHLEGKILTPFLGPHILPAVLLLYQSVLNFFCFWLVKCTAAGLPIFRVLNPLEQHRELSNKFRCN